MMKKRPYENPGKLFIDKYGLPHDIDDILKYTDFLYQQSKLNDQPPIDLTKIFVIIQGSGQVEEYCQKRRNLTPTKH